MDRQEASAIFRAVVIDHSRADVPTDVAEAMDCVMELIGVGEFQLPGTHGCRPEGSAADLAQHTVWKCPVDGVEWVVIQRMIGRKIHKQWVRRRVRA